MQKNQSSTDQPSSEKVNSPSNGRLQASIADQTDFDRDEAIKKFNTAAETGHAPDSTEALDFERIKQWIKANPKKSMGLGALGLFLIGRKRIYRLASLGVSTGAFTYLFTKIQENSNKHA